MEKHAYVTYARNSKDVEDALILLKSIKGTKSFKPVMILLDSENCGHDSWNKLAIAFDRVVKFRINGDYDVDDFRCQLFLTCTTLVDFDRICLVDPDAVVLKNVDDIFALDSTKSIFGNGIIVLTPGVTAHQDLLNYLNGTGSEKTLDQLKLMLLADSKATLLDKKFIICFDKDENDTIQAPKITYQGGHDTSELKPFNDILQYRNKLKHLEYSKPKNANEPVAIIGMSCRLPGSNNVSEYWKTLVDKKCVITPPPDWRWTQAHIGDQDRGKAECGFLPCPIDQFDSSFFEMSPAECNFTDPQQLLSLEVSWEALEDAGINPQTIHGTSTGIYVGSYGQDYRELLQKLAPPSTGGLRWYMGTALAAAAARQAHIYKTKGPTIAAEAACSSSSLAIGQAVQDLRLGACNLAIASGTNLLLQPYFQNDVVLSKDFRCKTFCTNANGFVRAEGVASLILKKLSDAVRDGDRIYSVILGFGMVQEGASKSIGTPTMEMEALAMELALKDAGIKPEQVQVVEAHGTGTALGDPLEIGAISKAYSTKERAAPLIITAGKANIGHTESTSGIAGVIKMTMAMKHGVIPEQIGISKLNPKINLENIPAIIPRDCNIPWPKANGVLRIAGISSFGFSGTNTHIIVQEWTSQAFNESIQSKQTEQENLLTISAKSEQALLELIENYKIFLSLHHDVTIRDVSYTANVGRAKFSHRVAVLAKNRDDLVNKLDKENWSRGIAGKLPKLCFLFTGQGSQFWGMGKQLYIHFPVFRENFDLCSKIILKLIGLNISDAIWGDSSKPHLSKSMYSQSSIFVVEYCLFKLWVSFGVVPSVVVGHSLGEFAAATAADLITLEDALLLVCARCRLINKLPPGRMLAVGVDQKTCKEIISTFLEARSRSDDWIDIAGMNTTNQTIVSGPTTVIHDFAEFCENNRIKSTKLGATHPFHSRGLDPILKDYAHVAKNITNQEIRGDDKCQFISSLDGAIKSQLSLQYWISHARNPVQFMAAMKTLQECIADEPYVFLEVGPHPVLSALLHSNVSYTPKCIPSMRRDAADEVHIILSALGGLFVEGVTINWHNFYQSSGSRQKVSIPFYPFQRHPFWFPFKSWSVDTARCKDILHPLLGRKIIPHPSSEESNITRYENVISTESHTWTLDHRVGNWTLMPAAGFLEIALAAQNLRQGENPYPLILENMKIQSPSVITEAGGTTYHTMLDDGNIIKIYSQVEKGKWTLNCTTSISRELFPVSKFAQSLVANHPKSTTETRDMYAELAKLGYHFGPTFQSIQSIWEDDGLSQMAKIYIPNNHLDAGERDVLHPILADSMIQLAMILSAKAKSQASFKLPIAIGRLIVNSSTKKERTTESYSTFYLKMPPGLETVSLFSSSGEFLACMTGVEFMPTNVSVLDRAIHSMLNENAHCPVYELQWTVDTTCRKFIANSSELRSVKLRLDSVIIKQSEVDIKNLLRSDQLIGLLLWREFVRASFEGLQPQFKLAHFMSHFRILPQFQKLATRYLQIFVEDEYISRLGNYYFTEGRHYESLQSVNKSVGNHLSEDQHDSLLLEIQAAVGNVLPTLRGEKALLALPDDLKDELLSSAETLYTEHAFQKIAYNNLRKVVEKIVCGPLNILEVGAGTGWATQCLISVLEEKGLDFSYTYTDVSSKFFKKSKAHFSQFEGKMQYSVLNIENDPKSQGFVPHKYDVVLVANALHRTRDLAQTTRNVAHLLKPGGHLLLIEMFKPQRLLDINFGSGFWEFQDFDLRPNYCVIDSREWENLLRTCGFQGLTCLSSWDDRSGLIVASKQTAIIKYVNICAKRRNWLIFGFNDEFTQDLINNLQISGEAVTLITVRNSMKTFEDNIDTDENDESEYARILSKFSEIHGIIVLWGLKPNYFKTESILVVNFLCLFQAISRYSGKLAKLFIVTHNIQSINMISAESYKKPTSALLVGMTKTFQSENATLECKLIDLDHQNSANVENVIQEVWLDMKDASSDINVCYHNGVRYTQQIFDYKPQTMYQPLSLPKYTNRTQLQLPVSKSIFNLELKELWTSELDGDELEVQVKAYSLNFRDIFAILKPTEAFDKINCVGADFSGVVSRIGNSVSKFKPGDLVFGSHSQNLALASHVTTSEKLVVNLPNNLTHEDACTIPLVGMTAYHCLCTVAQIRENHWVLIHTASGGVGLAAVQLAKKFGAKIIATAGNNRKRAYLKHIMGIQYVFNSRDLSFEAGVKAATEGLGVDIVLNSLTGKGFKEASLGCLKYEGKFIEMSKINVWTSEDCHKLRPDVKYSIEDISPIMDDLDKFKRLFLQLTNTLLEPLPYTRFQADEVKDALSFLEKAKHIGKVVVDMSNKKPFNDRSSYLVTGGCGGIGWEIVEWMLQNGAKYIILMSRNPPNAELLVKIGKLKESDFYVIWRQGDVGNINDCVSVFSWIKQQIDKKPLRGIFHCAGCLSDASFVNQTKQSYETALHPKFQGGWNLHELSKHLNLQYFVLFSSASSLVGTPGQSNYAAGNAFLDALAHHRQSVGLPAIALNWGHWGEVGLAAGQNISFVKPISTKEGLNSLNIALKSNSVQLCPIHMDAGNLVKLIPWTKSLLQSILKSEDTNRNKINRWHYKESVISSEQFWSEVNGCRDKIQQNAVVLSHVENLISFVLQMDGKNIPKNQNFSELGLDSLMMIEIKNRISTLLGDKVVLSINDLTDCDTLERLANKISELLSPKDDEGSYAKDGANDLITQDSKLWKHIKVNSTTKPCTPLREIKTIFLTGATGSVGPYMVQQLSLCPQIEKIYCLVRSRPNSTESTMARLQSRLKFLDLWDSTDQSKVTVVEGDISLENFGLDLSMYEILAQEVDAIVHFAIYTDHLHGYESLPSFKSVNVEGTQRIIQLSAEHRIKWINNASSLTCFPQNLERLKQMDLEAWPKNDDYDTNTSFGYGISKFIGERLLAQAVEIGIPCKSFRFPVVSGASLTGKQDLGGGSSHALKRLIHLLSTGIIPETTTPLIHLPADICAKICISIFFNEEAPSSMYNVVNPHTSLEIELLQLVPELGTKLIIIQLYGFALKKAGFHDKELFVSHWITTCKENGINLEYFKEILLEFIDDPGRIFDNEGVAEYLKSQEFEGDIGSYDDFLDSLKSCEMSLLRPYVDMYKQGGTIYNFAQISSSILETVGDRIVDEGKVSKYFPNLKEIVPNGIECIRNDINYAIINGAHLFQTRK